MSTDSPTFDRAAAVTRSLLGWGVVAGPFYLVVGLVLALTRPGFELGEHALSLLMLGDGGWMQRTNLVLAGAMVIAAAVGIGRAVRDRRGRRMRALVLVFGGCLVLGAVFPPDPVAGFPPGATSGDLTTSGLLHLAFGAIGFLALAAAAVVHAGWCRELGERGRGRVGLVLAAVIVVAFLGGAALATQPAGVLLLWVAVAAGWLWLALASAHVYAWSPHPDGPQRRSR